MEIIVGENSNKGFCWRKLQQRLLLEKTPTTARTPTTAFVGESSNKGRNGDSKKGQVFIAMKKTLTMGSLKSPANSYI